MPSGTRLGRYELIGLIGAGGMGEVYRARDERLSRDVAIKVLPQQLSRDPERLARLETEARAAGALNHPAILSVFDLGQEEETAYIVTELLEGKTLRKVIPPRGLPLERVFDFARQIASGLAAAHGKGIVHGDLKPDNLFVTDDGRLKILDFGLARSVKPAAQISADAKTAPLACPEELAGTLGYVAPEQLRNEAADHRADIFSFGIVLYEMASGEQPFRGTSTVEALNAILNVTPEPIERRVPDAPPSLVRIVDRCLQKDPANRFQTAADLLFALESASLPLELRGSWIAASDVSAARRRQRRRVGLAVAASAAVVGALVLGLWRPWRSLHALPIRTLAVLPLVNLSGDPGQDYLVDGVHEELIASLAKIHTLNVISRTSVMRFRDTELPIRKIAKELRVEAVIEGSVRRSGAQVRTTFQLVAADTEQHLWAETYQTEMRDILTLQSQVAQTVADAVRARLTTEERARLSRVAPVDPEAYQLYLQGRFHWNQATPSSLRNSIDLFSRAVAIEPSLTLAHVGLVEARGLIGEMESLPAKDFVPDLEASARKALAADPDSGEAQASVGFAILYGAEGWDWGQAERAFRRALELAPSYANGHAWYAGLLSLLGRHDEAVAHARRASELDPLNPFLSSLVASRLYYARRLTAALDQTERLEQTQPDYWINVWIRGLTLQAMGRLDEAVVELRRAVELSAPSLECVPDLAATLARAGQEAEARAILARLRQTAKKQYVPPWAFVIVHTGLGEKSAALDWLERAYAEADWRIAWIGPELALDPLRGDPRFEELLRSLHLPASRVAPP